MDKLQRQLMCDHRRIKRVLNNIEAEVRRCEYEPAEAVDFARVLEGLEYISDYPELVHHPLEERVIKAIQRKAVVNGLARIRSQHNYLEQQTRRFKVLFTAIADGCSVNIKQVFASFYRYCMLQREHIELEDAVLLPAIAAHLSPRQCALIRQEADTPEREAAVAEYSDVYHAVISEQTELAA